MTGSLGHVRIEPRSPPLWAPNRNKPTQPSWKTPQQRTYSIKTQQTGWLRNRTGTGNRNRRNRFSRNRKSESVKCRFSKCRFSALNLKFDFISDGVCTCEKQIQKALGSLPPCGNRCRFSESAICSSRVHPPSEIKSNFKFKTLRWRPLRWRLTLSEKAEPQPPEPSSRNRNRNWNRSFLLICTERQKTLFAEEPPEPKTGTARTVPAPNRNRTEPNRGLPEQRRKTTTKQQKQSSEQQQQKQLLL